MIGRWLIYLTALACCTTLSAVLQVWLAWALLHFALLLPLFSLVVSLPAMLTVRLGVVCPDTLNIGDEFLPRLDTRCVLPAPPIRGQLRITHSFTGKSFRLKPGTSLPTDHCGQLICSPERVVCFDYLGLFRIGVRHKENAEVFVRPKALPMPLPADLETRICRSWYPKPGGGFSENHEVRLYRPGDSLNQIHWKLTAKVGKPMIREAMIPRQQAVLLVLTLQGEPAELDRKLGRLLWVGQKLLAQNIPFEIRAFTAEGLLCLQVQDEQQLLQKLDTLLTKPLLQEQTPVCGEAGAWQLLIGGDDDGA